MSAHAGVYYRDGRRIPSELAHVIESTICTQGPNGRGIHSSGSYLAISRASYITPEARFERQPLVGANGAVLTWDGRLDNREDLLAQLTLPLVDTSDAEAVLAAWYRWGPECFARLIGDWAVTVWEPQKQILHLARDYAGACPLFYGVSTGAVFWSSELETFLAPQVRDQLGGMTLDEGWIAGYLARYPGMCETPYHQVRSVIPGYAVRLTITECIPRQHWCFAPDMQIRYRNDFEYEEQFRFELREAVRCRLRSVGPVWAHLSGGLDSSAIVCVADDLVKRGQATVPSIETVSAVYPDSPESDESRFIAYVEKWRAKPGHHFSDREHPLVTADAYEQWPATPHFIDSFAVRERAIVDSMATGGSRIQLSGEGGDELLGSIGSGVPNQLDDIWMRNWPGLWKDIVVWSSALRVSRVQCGINLLNNLLPESRHNRSDVGIAYTRSLIDNSFAKRNHIDDRFVGGHDAYGIRRPSSRGRSQAFQSIVHRVSALPFRRFGPVHVTFPYLDRRLLSFLLALPMDQLARDGQPRSLMRRALASIVPMEVLRRGSKTSPDSALYRALIRHWYQFEDIMRTPVVCEHGFVDRDAFQTAAQKTLHGTFPVTALLKVIMLELWLRNRNGITSPVSAPMPVAALV